MSYSTLIEMSSSRSLRQRVVACAAQEGAPSPEGWVSDNHWDFMVLTDWGAAWEYATATLTVNQNPDIGVRTDVITDQMILSAVQAKLAV